MNTSTKILVLGILSIICLPIFGPFAWIMGNNALSAIDAGQADPSERSNIAAGRICGIIGTVLLIIGVIWAIAVFAFGLTMFRNASTINGVPINITTTTTSRQSDTLSSAITNQDVNAVNRILDHDRSLANKKGVTGETPIFDAAFVGNKEIVQALIDHGADVNATDDFGKRPLDKAIFFSRVNVIDLLKQHGATAGKGN